MGLERALRRDAGGGDVGTGAAGGAAAADRARGGGRRDRGQSRALGNFPRRTHHLPRSGRRGAARVARGAHARGTTLIRRTKIVATLRPATRIPPPRVEGRVQAGGTLTSNKGMTLPGLHVSAPALTEKDREDAAHAASVGADYLALSFVRRAEDLAELRALVPPQMKLVAKIEKATALDDLPRILAASDAVMVARGDLGVELPFEEVPVVQKRLIREANRHGKPVITATQMLESMVHHPRPTRAEASDVANAILDGTDAVMLSAETAVGEYPLEA